MTTDPLIGRTLTIPPSPHTGHTVTVERRDLEKHQAYWLRCECGAQTLVGAHWLPKYLDGSEPIWKPGRDPLGLV